MWRVGGVELDTIARATAYANATITRPLHPAECSPVMRNIALDEHVAATQPETMRRVRRYLSAVYPVGRFASSRDVTDIEALSFFRSLVHAYQGVEGIDVPLDAVEPTSFAVRSDASEAAVCTSSAGEEGNAANATTPLRGILTRSPHLLYHGLVPCRRGVECARALGRFAPRWLDGVQATAAGDAFFEVRRYAASTLDLGRLHPPDPQLRPPRSWSDFEDAARIHGSAWWYIHAPGSGIFYKAGKTLAAPTKTSMLVKLLEEWLGPEMAAIRNATATLRAELQRVAGADVPTFLERLKSVHGGNQSCHEAHVPQCYADVFGDSYQTSWTLYDAPYDDLTLRLGRVLGYDTLFFSASFLHPDVPSDASGALQNDVVWTMPTAPIGAEVVDLRRPAWAAGTEGEETSDAWARGAGSAARADAWAEDVRQRGTLSLRDPLDPARGSVTACDFEPTHTLACRGHASWEFRNGYPGLLHCDMPHRTLARRFPAAAGAVECADWCEDHSAPWRTKCSFARCGGCREWCEPVGDTA